jgi:hypothetical protein
MMAWMLWFERSIQADGADQWLMTRNPLPNSPGEEAVEKNPPENYLASPWPPSGGGPLWFKPSLV